MYDTIKLNWPWWQFWQDNDDSLLYFPAEHDVHSVAAVMLLVWKPLGHVKQLSLNACGAYLPNSQFTHVVWLYECWPFKHSPHEILSILDNVPVGHVKHDDCPSMILYWPPGHLLHSEGNGADVNIEYLPGIQSIHEPLLLIYCPEIHVIVGVNEGLCDNDGLGVTLGVNVVFTTSLLEVNPTILIYIYICDKC